MMALGTFMSAVFDILLQEQCNKTAAKRFFSRLVRLLHPRKLLPIDVSYRAVKRELAVLKGQTLFKPPDSPYKTPILL